MLKKIMHETQKKNKKSIFIRMIDAFFSHARAGQFQRNGLRTNFNLALWAAASVFLYFLLIYFYIYMNEISSGGNTALFFVLVGAVFMALLGAFYSPKLSLIFKLMSPAGRREKFSKDQKKIVNKKKKYR